MADTSIRAKYLVALSRRRDIGRDSLFPAPLPPPPLTIISFFVTQNPATSSLFPPLFYGRYQRASERVIERRRAPRLEEWEKRSFNMTERPNDGVCQKTSKRGKERKRGGERKKRRRLLSNSMKFHGEISRHRVVNSPRITHARSADVESFAIHRPEHGHGSRRARSVN